MDCIFPLWGTRPVLGIIKYQALEVICLYVRMCGCLCVFVFITWILGTREEQTILKLFQSVW